jgi:hypothetical protein
MDVVILTLWVSAVSNHLLVSLDLSPWVIEHQTWCGPMSITQVNPTAADSCWLGSPR